MNITPYHAKYFAYELTRQHASNDIGKLAASLQDAQVDLNPHQVEAALFAFKSPLSKGAILADEVGLGKTIEAGIIVSQKWAENKRKLLIIGPANLRKQWSQELIDKFYLPSMILEAKSFNQEIKSGKSNPFKQEEIVICSFQFARTKEEYVRNVNWDLVIIDEAHRLRNVYKPSNKIGKAIKQALHHSKKVLLTATPLQNSLLELYGLVSIIDEYAFGDIKSYKSQYARLTGDENFFDLKGRLKPICNRTLRKQVLEYINYTNRIALVEEFYPYEEEIELYELVSEYLRKPRLHALPSSQRQLMTLILRKLLASSSFAIQGTLTGLADKLEILLKDQSQLSLYDIESDFETLSELEDEWGEPVPGHDIYDELVLEEVQDELNQLRRFASLAKSIVKNSKGDKLLTALSKGFEKLKELGAQEKAIIFTESTRTQAYLKNILETQGYQGKTVLFNGSNNDPDSKEIFTKWLDKHQGTDRITGSRTADKRQAIVDYFKYDATIMIATEAAAEGINLQFCSLVVNYDLPWNPQRIEQRIGRCHRYGQKHDVVVINFLNKANAADQRVYELLDQKFKLFNGIFGSSDEVLGSLESGVDFEKRISQIYQECRTPEEIKLAFDGLQSELEPEIEHRLDKTRQQLLENFDHEVHEKLRINLESGKEYLNKYEQWLWKLTKFHLNGFATYSESEDSFRLNQNPFPEENIHSGPYRLLKSSSNRRKSEIEIEDDTNVYRIGHPLAQRIIDAGKKQELETVSMKFDYSGTPKKITVLESLIGTSGLLQLSLLSITSFEKEEYLLFTGTDDRLESIDPSILQNLFNLSAEEGESIEIPDSVMGKLRSLEKKASMEILGDSNQRNSDFFDLEYDKLEKWADDMKISLEKEIKDLDAEIKLKKMEARKTVELKNKVALQRTIKDLEKKRNEKRKSLFVAQDEIDNKKDHLLEDIESRMNQSINLETLFTIQWELI